MIYPGWFKNKHTHPTVALVSFFPKIFFQISSFSQSLDKRVTFVESVPTMKPGFYFVSDGHNS
jgi:hypothetical protein